MQVYKAYCAVAVSVAVIGFVLLCLWSPWRQVSPQGALILSRAPIWTRPNVPGASIDLKRWLGEAAGIVIIAGLIARIGRGTRTNIPPKAKP